MDARHAQHLKPGTRVAVYMGAGAAIPSTVPIVTTATVRGLDPAGGVFKRDGVWLDVDIAAGEVLPQRYGVEEVIGFLLPMANVQRSADGQTVTATFPDGTVAP